MTLKIFSNVLYRYGSITFSTEIVDFFSVAIIVETAAVHISVLMNSSSSLFVNLLISLDTGQVEISCVNQLGPFIQLLLFGDNSFGKHSLDGRSTIFSCHDFVQIAYNAFSRFESMLTLLLSQLNIELLILEIFLLKQNTHYVPIWLVTDYSLTLIWVWLAL